MYERNCRVSCWSVYLKKWKGHMQRHLANSDERQSLLLGAASFLSGFLNRPKTLRGNISTAAKICPFATEPQQDFNSSPDRAEHDV